MKTYESAILAGTMVGAVGILTSCASSIEGAPDATTVDNSIFVEDVRNEVQEAFDEARSFWTTQSATILPSLHFPENDETITCGTEMVSPNKGREVVAAACLPTDTMIVWLEPFTEQIHKAINSGVVMRTAVRLVVNHEYAHFVQKEFNVLGHPDYRSIVEPQADCMAGGAMRSTSPNALPSVGKYYEAYEASLGHTDYKHGTAAQRLASFTMGYAPKNGKNCDDVMPLSR